MDPGDAGAVSRPMSRVVELIMDRNSVDWRGYIPAIVTPFDEAGALDLERLTSMLEWLIGEGLHGLVVAGTTGEWFSLTLEEKRQLFARTGEVVAGRIPVIAGCNAYTAREASANVALAVAAKLDGILLTPPPYVKPSVREIISFYQAVAKTCPLPICIYNWPPGTNVDMQRPVLEELADIDQVVAIKNSSSDIGGYTESFFALKDRVRFFGFASNELGLNLLRYHGLDGTMGAAAALGRDQPLFYESIWAGEMEAARRFMERDRYFMQQLFNPDLTAKLGSAQAVFKEALNLQGVSAGYVRDPILPLGAEERDVVRQTLAHLGKIKG
jgi:4-hydroxy-tetrahydrodipicolinate synthase